MRRQEYVHRTYTKAQQKKRGMLKGSQKDRNKVKALCDDAAKKDAKVRAEHHAEYLALAAQGRVTKRKANGSYYILG